jgi:hypothetical protein
VLQFVEFTVTFMFHHSVYLKVDLADILQLRLQAREQLSLFLYWSETKEEDKYEFATE